MYDDPLPPLRDVIKKHDLRAKKSLGQNFLLDLNLTRKIARASGGLQGHLVIEIGPGPGGLTRALLSEGAGHVVAIEKDQRCLRALEDIQNAFPNRLTIVEGDALAIDETALLRDISKYRKVKVIANLPYNVGTALLIKWLSSETWPTWFDELVLMFQKEVAERLVASPGSKAYGRLSVIASWRTLPALLFDVPPQAFTPAPKITSTLVSLKALPKPVKPADRADLESVVAAAFGQRRKMLRQSLKSLGIDTSMLLEDANLNPTSRAEVISVEAFCDLANSFTKMKPK